METDIFYFIVLKRERERIAKLVLESKDIMSVIFGYLDPIVDRFNVVVICKKWKKYAEDTFDLNHKNGEALHKAVLQNCFTKERIGFEYLLAQHDKHVITHTNDNNNNGKVKDGKHKSAVKLDCLYQPMLQNTTKEPKALRNGYIRHHDYFLENHSAYAHNINHVALTDPLCESLCSLNNIPDMSAKTDEEYMTATRALLPFTPALALLDRVKGVKKVIVDVNNNNNAPPPSLLVHPWRIPKLKNECFRHCLMRLNITSCRDDARTDELARLLSEREGFYEQVLSDWTNIINFLICCDVRELKWCKMLQILYAKDELIYDSNYVQGPTRVTLVNRILFWELVYSINTFYMPLDKSDIESTITHLNKIWPKRYTKHIDVIKETFILVRKRKEHVHSTPCTIDLKCICNYNIFTYIAKWIKFQMTLFDKIRLLPEHDYRSKADSRVELYKEFIYENCMRVYDTDGRPTYDIPMQFALDMLKATKNIDIDHKYECIGSYLLNSNNETLLSFILREDPAFIIHLLTYGYPRYDSGISKACNMWRIQDFQDFLNNHGHHIPFELFMVVFRYNPIHILYYSDYLMTKRFEECTGAKYKTQFIQIISDAVDKYVCNRTTSNYPEEVEMERVDWLVCTDAWQGGMWNPFLMVRHTMLLCRIDANLIEPSVWKSLFGSIRALDDGELPNIYFEYLLGMLLGIGFKPEKPANQALVHANTKNSIHLSKWLTREDSLDVIDIQCRTIAHSEKQMAVVLRDALKKYHLSTVRRRIEERKRYYLSDSDDEEDIDNNNNNNASTRKRRKNT